MKLKKRRKSSRHRGTRTCGWAMKKHKGSGNRGGKGMAGTGKRADQKKTYVIKYHFPYFGKRGFTSKPTARKKANAINLKEIAEKFSGQKEINLKDHKILGEGDGINAVITAKSASKSAIEKMEKAGGKIIVEKAGKEKVEEKAKSEESKEEKKLEEKGEKKEVLIKGKEKIKKEDNKAGR